MNCSIADYTTRTLQLGAAWNSKLDPGTFSLGLRHQHSLRFPPLLFYPEADIGHITEWKAAWLLLPRLRTPVTTMARPKPNVTGVQAGWVHPSTPRSPGSPGRPAATLISGPSVRSLDCGEPVSQGRTGSLRGLECHSLPCLGGLLYPFCLHTLGCTRRVRPP